MSEQRIIELEIKLAYQDDLLQSLNDTISQQQQQMQGLKEGLALLHQRQQILAESIQVSSEDDQSPPHY
jgi:SlyX protein